MIFGSSRDCKTLLHIRRELLQDVVEQEILYYAIDLESTKDNIYGEAEIKMYWQPVRLTCLIKRGDQQWKVDEFGPDLNRVTSFAFVKEDFKDLNFKPSVGDVICWSNHYFECDGIKENQLFLGKDEDYRLDPNRTHKFGESVSIVCQTHLTRYTKLNIVNYN